MATISDLLPPTTTPLHHALKKAGFESVDHCKQWFKCINMSHGTVEEMCRTVESWVDKWDRKEGRMTLQEMVVALHQASVEKLVKSKKMILVKNVKASVSKNHAGKKKTILKKTVVKVKKNSTVLARNTLPSCPATKDEVGRNSDTDKAIFVGRNSQGYEFPNQAFSVGYVPKTTVSTALQKNERLRKTFSTYIGINYVFHKTTGEYYTKNEIDSFMGLQLPGGLQEFYVVVQQPQLEPPDVDMMCRQMSNE